MGWLDEIIEAFRELGGIASYKELYDQIKKKRKNLPKSWQAIIRAYIERHSSDSKAYENKQDIFYSVSGIGKGIWGLRDYSPRKEIIYAEDMEEVDDKIPQRKKGETYRVLRDSALTLSLKKLYENKCQVCGLRIKIREGVYYSEAHHLKPLAKHNGPDIAENIIILCPNHHVEFDYGAIAVNPDNYEILHIDPENPLVKEKKKLYVHKNHRIRREFLVYHLKNIFKKDLKRKKKEVEFEEGMEKYKDEI